MVALHASTIRTHSSIQLLSYLTNITSPHRDSVLLYALSTNAPNLEYLVSRLSAVSSESIGCLSGPLPQQPNVPHFSCSLAFFSTKNCVPFRSTLAGEQPVQVGRWHAFRKMAEQDQAGSEESLTENVDWEDLWSRKNTTELLPAELNGLRLDYVHNFLDTACSNLNQ